MPGNYIGVLLPKQHPSTQQVGPAWPGWGSSAECSCDPAEGRA